jgi:hypothetical protein
MMTTRPDVNKVTYTVEAMQTRHELPTERQAMLDHAMKVLAKDPFHKTATASIGANENYRKAYVAPGLMLEYTVVREILVVVLLEIFDESRYLLDLDVDEVP